MAEYYAVFKKGGAESSDAPFAEGLKPTESGKILGAIEQGSFVLLEATTEAEAATAARAAYPGRANNKIIIIPKANWKEI